MAWPCQAFERDADHGEAKEGGDGCCVAFEVAGKTAIPADPGVCPLDDPSLRQDDETMNIGAFDDLDSSVPQRLSFAPFSIPGIRHRQIFAR